MRIALLAHLRHPISPPFMGGMEAHSYHLARALQARGHDVTLFAAGGSDAGVELWPVLERHYEPDFPWHDYHGTDALNDFVDEAFSRVVRRLARGDFDVVHNNSLHRYPPRLARVRRLPMVTSLHVPAFDWLRRAVHESAAPWSRFTATTRAHASSYWPDEMPETAHVIGNGVDLTQWPFRENGDASLIWAGRLAPNKGPQYAVRAAAEAGLRLDLYGPLEVPGWFDEEIGPYLSDRIRYRGHVNGEELAAAMGRAGAFVFTPMWEEPFGLVAIEAMASGLPVAAFDRGGVREVVGEDAGRFVESGDAGGLARAMHEALDIPRATARRRVEEHFSIGAMVDAYEEVYRAAIRGVSEEVPTVEFPEIELRVAA